MPRSSFSRDERCANARPHASLGYKPPAPEVFVPAFAAWPAALRQPVGRCQERGFDDGKQRRGPLSSPYLVNVSCNDRRAEQVTRAEGYGPYRSASVEKPCRHAHAIRPRVIETGNIVEVSLDPQDDALPRHVFHAYTNRPTGGQVGEIRILPGYEIPGAGGYPHTGPAGLGIKHRAVPSIADPRGDGANLVDANRSREGPRLGQKVETHEGSAAIVGGCSTTRYPRHRKPSCPTGTGSRADRRQR